MMGFDAGNNYGLTGIIDIGTNSSAKLIVTVRGFGAGLSAKVHDITGPGSNFNQKLYGSTVSGGGTFDGEAKTDLCPLPITFHNLQGTLTLQYGGTTSTIAFPVLLDGESVTRNEKTSNMWRVSGSWKKNGAYSLNWGGTQSYTQPTLILSEIFSGTSKTLDPNNLQQSAVELWFLPINGSANSDMQTAVTAFQGSATAPVPNLKLATCSVDRLDDAAGLMTVHWRTRSTADEVTLPPTAIHSDPNNLQSTATVGTLNATTGTLTGFSLRSVTYTPIWTNGTSTAYRTVSGFGLRTTLEDHTFPGNYIVQDNSSLNTRGVGTVIQVGTVNSYSPPSGLVVVSSRMTTLTSALGASGNLYEWVHNLGLRTSEQDHTFPGTFVVQDVSSLHTYGVGTVIQSSSSPTYSPPTGLVVVSRKVVRLTSALGAGDRYKGVFNLGLKTPEQSVLFSGNIVHQDNYSLNTTALHTVISSDSAPSYVAPTGLKIVRSYVQQLTGSLGTANRFQGVWQLATRDSYDNEVFPHTYSSRTAMNGYSDSTADIIAASGTVANQANSLYANFTSEAFAWALELHPRTDGLRKVIKRYRNPGWKEIIKSRGSKLVEVRKNGSAIEVYVLHNIAMGNGWRRLYFCRQRVNSRKVRRFVLRRVITSPVVPEDSGSSINGVTLPDIGTVNSASFQGNPAGQCIYEGPDMTVHLGMPGITTFPMEVGWIFRTDSQGIFNNIPQGMFSRRGYPLLTNYTGTGWTDVTTLGAPFSDISAPTSASFAGFIA
jgi:hypothetical protein